MICHKISKQAKLMLVRVVLKLDKIRDKTLVGKIGNLLFLFLTYHAIIHKSQCDTHFFGYEAIQKVT